MKKISNNWDEGKQRMLEEMKHRKVLIGEYYDEKYKVMVKRYAGVQDIPCHSSPVGYAREYD